MENLDQARNNIKFSLLGLFILKFIFQKYNDYVQNSVLDFKRETEFVFQKYNNYMYIGKSVLDIFCSN